MTAAAGWCFADVWEEVARARPDALAAVHGDREVSWAAFERRAGRVAGALVRAGLGRQAKVAQYLYNSPEFTESLFAIWKAALVPVNTNYRYGVDEIADLWDDADVEAVVFHRAFHDQVSALRDRCPRIRTWLCVDDGGGGRPDWSVPYEDLASDAAFDAVALPPRSADDLYLLYTGGTTGRPKGVMWRQHDLFSLLSATAKVRYPVEADPTVVRDLLVGPGPVLVPACPLMHGTGAMAAMSALSSGGTVVTLEGRRFSAEELLRAIERRRVDSVAIVGDAFARPILDALDAPGASWDISSLRIITSSGVMWSTPVKEGLLRHNGRLILADLLGSSEAVGMATSVSTAGSGASSTASFELSDEARVIAEDDTFVEPGSGRIGMVGIRGHMPIGYYKDAEKTAATFRIVDGERFSVPGDFATVEADGTIVLLGRGSICINTGGEKVFPEEVEEAVKEVPPVRDAVVVGLPDERFGEAIVAVVEPSDGAAVDAAAVVDHVRSRLARYKAPRHVLVVPTLDRAANGKVDYARWRRHAEQEVGAATG